MIPRSTPDNDRVTVLLYDARVEQVASAVLLQDGDDVELQLTATALPAGTHGIHFHEVARCDAPDFASAGGHFNPAARAHGLDTCPQAAFTPFHRIVVDAIGAPAEEQLVCGMSLGMADMDAIENTLVTEREPVAHFARFLD